MSLSVLYAHGAIAESIPTKLTWAANHGRRTTEPTPARLPGLVA